MKYTKITNNIDTDYRNYLSQENIYGVLFGHKMTKKDTVKANYIWKRLLKLHKITN